MKRWIILLTLASVLAAAPGVALTGLALADANERASCFGLEASAISPPGSSGEFPGGAAEAVSELREAAHELGAPPGAIVSAFASLHEGSHEACDEAFE